MSASRVDVRAVAEGALVALAVTLPPVWIVQLLKGDDLPGQESNLWFVPVLSLLAGFALGGFRAGRRGRTSPLVHATVAAAAAMGVIVVITLVRKALSHESVGVATALNLLLLTQICVSVALLGGYLSTRRRGSET